MVLKWLENIDRVGKIKSCNSKSGLIFLLRWKPESLQPICVFVARNWFEYVNKNLKTAKMDRKGSGFGLSKKITPLLLLQLLILPTLAMFVNDFVHIW